MNELRVVNMRVKEVKYVITDGGRSKPLYVKADTFLMLDAKFCKESLSQCAVFAVSHDDFNSESVLSPSL